MRGAYKTEACHIKKSFSNIFCSHNTKRIVYTEKSVYNNVLICYQ